MVTGGQFPRRDTHNAHCCPREKCMGFQNCCTSMYHNSNCNFSVRKDQHLIWLLSRRDLNGDATGQITQSWSSPNVRVSPRDRFSTCLHYRAQILCSVGLVQHQLAHMDRGATVAASNPGAINRQRVPCLHNSMQQEQPISFVVRSSCCSLSIVLIVHTTSRSEPLSADLAFP